MLILASNISRAYGSPPFQFSALRPTSLDIEQGEFVAIVGAKPGSGKSTLFPNSARPARQPFVGAAIFRRQGLHDPGARRSRPHQKPPHRLYLPAIPLAAAAQRPAQCRAASDLRRGIAPAKGASAARRRSSWLGLRIQGEQLAGEALGRRAAAGRRCRRSRGGIRGVQLADEPTGALDTASGQEVLRLIQQLHDDGRTIVMVTHDLHIASQAHASFT